MADLTTDIEATVGIWSLGDFRPDMPKVSGVVALVHRLCLRLQTKRGRFPWWPNFGTNIAQYLLSKTPPAQIAAAAEAECRKDEQVQQVKCEATLEDSGRRVRLDLQTVASSGPFALSLSITQAKLELIALQLPQAA